MKSIKRLSVLIVCAVMLFTLFCACGSSSNGKASYDSAEYEMAPAEAPAAPMPNAEEFDSVAGISYSYSSEDGTASAAPAAELGRKLIYTYTLYVETLDYSGSISSVASLTSEYGGYIESSYVEAGGINSENHYRYASYTLRIPSERVAKFVASCGSIGAVTSQHCDTDDRTASYIDMSARRDTLETEEAALNELLAKAENVDSIIALTERLSEVRYEIESLEASLRSIDSLVEFSTVNLELQEVIKISEVEDSAPRTFGERVSARAFSTWSRFCSEIEDIGVYLIGEFPLKLVLFIIYALPFIIIVVIVILVIRAVRRRKSGSAATRRERKAIKKALRRQKAEDRKDEHIE